MWNYHGNASCSWQEILLSQARDKGAIKNTFLHSFSCSPPTGRHYLAFETQDSAFGNQLVFGRWWEPVVWWETRCLQYLLCCSWSKFLFSYVFNSAEKCQKISFHVYYFHAQTNRFAGLEGGRVERCHRTCRTSSAGVAKQHWVPKQMCRLGGCWVMVSSWCLVPLPPEAACSHLWREGLWDPGCLCPMCTQWLCVRAAADAKIYQLYVAGLIKKRASGFRIIKS